MKRFLYFNCIKVEKGIKSWTVYFHPFYSSLVGYVGVEIHEKGSFNPESPSELNDPRYSVEMDVEIEKFNVLDYNGIPCEADPTYSLDECRDNFFQQVS